jgi:hypothetical protein
MEPEINCTHHKLVTLSTWHTSAVYTPYSQLEYIFVLTPLMERLIKKRLFYELLAIMPVVIAK